MHKAGNVLIKRCWELHGFIDGYNTIQAQTMGEPKTSNRVGKS
jgi:hypothetical protein